MRWVRVFVCLILFPQYSGCITQELDENLMERRADVNREISELREKQQVGGSEAITWDQALKILNERNLNLQQSRIRIESLRKARDDQWKNWIPRVGVYANLLSSIAELGSLSNGDLNASVVAPLNIPNPATERAQAFANSLSYLEGVDSLEVNNRREVSSLYRLFSRYETLLANEAERSKKHIGAESVNTALSNIETQVSHRESISSIQENLASLLNLPGENPTPVPGTKPNLDYEHRINKLVPGKNYGLLAVRLYAYQIEGAILREKGVEMSQWPSTWFSGTTPALYDSNQEGSGSYDSDRISLFAGISRTYDITGREADTIKNAKDNTEFVKKSLRLRMDREVRDWNRLRQRYDQLVMKRQIAKERLQNIQQQDRGSAMTDLNTLRSARSLLNGIESSMEQLELEIWLWDDEKWQ